MTALSALSSGGNARRFYFAAGMIFGTDGSAVRATDTPRGEVRLVSRLERARTGSGAATQYPRQGNVLMAPTPPSERNGALPAEWMQSSVVRRPRDGRSGEREGSTWGTLAVARTTSGRASP